MKAMSKMISPTHFHNGVERVATRIKDLAIQYGSWDEVLETDGSRQFLSRGECLQRKLSHEEGIQVHHQNLGVGRGDGEMRGEEEDKRGGSDREMRGGGGGGGG